MTVYSDNPYNPKTRNLYQANRAGAFGAVSNPIANELLDVERVQQLYGKYPIVPFFDDGDATLDLFARLRRLSPTNAACITSIGQYALGGGFHVRKRRPMGFSRVFADDKLANEAETNNFVSEITQLASLGDWIRLAGLVYDNRKTYGNAFVEVVVATVMGKPVVRIYNHDAPTCRYLASFDNQPKMILISKIWDAEYLERNPPKAVFAYPDFSVDENGTKRTIIHSKREVSGRPWYGEPDYISNLYYSFNEMQSGEYQTDAFARRFTGEIFFETASNLKYDLPEESGGYLLDDDEDQYYLEDNFEDKLMQVFTRLGSERKTILHRRRGIAEPKTEVHEFNKTQDAKYFESILAIDEKQIIKSHGWSYILLGQPTPGKLGGNQEFQDIFRAKFWTVIQPWQEIILRILNQVLAIAEAENAISTNEWEFGLVNIFQEMMMQDPTENTNTKKETDVIHE